MIGGIFIKTLKKAIQVKKRKILIAYVCLVIQNVIQ